MNCSKCSLPIVNGACGCEKPQPSLSGTKCACGRWARIKHEDQMLCWECRGILLKETPNEDWRDKMCRDYCRENDIHKLDRKEQIKLMKTFSVRFEETIKKGKVA